MPKRLILKEVQACFNDPQYFAVKKSLFYAVGITSFLVSCGSPPSTPSRPNGEKTERSSQNASPRLQKYPNAALLEKTMAEHLNQFLLEGDAVKEDEIYTIELANQSDIQKFNDTYVCKTKLGAIQPSQADDLDEAVADKLIEAVDVLGVEALEVRENLSLQNSSSSKRIVLLHNVDLGSCDIWTSPLSVTDMDRFLIEESVYVPVGPDISEDESVDIGLSALAASVNRGGLRVNREVPESTLENMSLADSNRLLDSFASVLITLEESKVVSIAPLSVALAETVPGTADEALLTGIARIVSVNLALVNNNQIQQPSSTPTQNAGTFLTGIFSWFSGLVSGTAPGGTGQTSPIGNLPGALGLLTTSPQLILANALLQVFLNGGITPTGQPSPGKPVAALSSIPDYAGALGLSADVNLHDLLTLLGVQNQYVATHFDGRIKESLNAYLALSYSQGFRKRMPLVARQETP